MTKARFDAKSVTVDDNGVPRRRAEGKDAAELGPR